MISQLLTWQTLKPTALLLLPLSLWLMLIFSLQPGSLSDIIHPGLGLISFLHGLRAAFPLTAALVAMIIIVFKLRRRPANRALFLGPLGLTALYGLVGIPASIISPDGSAALYWAVSFLAVPLVLWAIVSGPYPSELISRVINLNLLIVVLVSGGMFVFAMINLNLGDFLLNPDRWNDCKDLGWFIGTSEYLRATGVGRFGAITAIVALSRFWQPGWRPIWVLIFLASLVLILSSGSRTPLVGFLVAAPIVFLLSSGKTAALRSIGLIMLLTPVVLATGIHSDLIACLTRSAGLTAPSTPPNTSQATVTAPSSAEQFGTPAPGAIGSSPTSPDGTSTPYNPNPLATPVSESVSAPSRADIPEAAQVRLGFFSFTGRREVWWQALVVFKQSPILGHGFHADRLILGTHAHNSVIHSLIQTGVAGTIPFLAALLLGWFFLIRSLGQLNHFASTHKIFLIQAAGIFTFLSIRTLTESTGAFFGVDWLILGPFLLYFGFLQPSRSVKETP